MIRHTPRARLERITSPRCARALTVIQQLEILAGLPGPFMLRDLSAAITGAWPRYHAVSVPIMAEAAIADWLARGAIERTQQPGMPRYRVVR